MYTTVHDVTVSKMQTQEGYHIVQRSAAQFQTCSSLDQLQVKGFVHELEIDWDTADRYDPRRVTLKKMVRCD